MSTTTPNDSAASHATARVITPPGQAGIAVIQLTGTDALRIIHDLFESKNFSDNDSPNQDKLYFGRFLDGPQVIDDVIVACRRTHQDAWRIEINCHGGLRVIERILTALAMRGAKVVRDARSVDLAWAGGSRFEKQVLELAIRMPTRRLAKWVLHQRTALPKLVTRMLDDMEHDSADRVAVDLDHLITRYPQTALLIRGIKIALIGPPNAGKSTLINALSGLKGSIVSDGPGTTRDWVEHPAAIDGIPIRYIDTAGIGTPRDDVDCQAMDRARDQATAADLRLLVLDQNADWPSSQLLDLSNLLAPPSLAVLNKTDLPPAWPTDHLDRITGILPESPLRVSSLHKTGLAPLLRAIQAALGLTDFSDRSPTLLADWQLESARDAREALHSNPHVAPQYVRKLVS